MEFENVNAFEKFIYKNPKSQDTYLVLKFLKTKFSQQNSCIIDRYFNFIKNNNTSADAFKSIVTKIINSINNNSTYLDLFQYTYLPKSQEDIQPPTLNKLSQKSYKQALTDPRDQIIADLREQVRDLKNQLKAYQLSQIIQEHKQYKQQQQDLITFD